MELLTSFCRRNKSTIPRHYIVQPQEQPIEENVPVFDCIPTIDLSRVDIIHQILKAGQDYGIFQVINHGVHKKTVANAMSVFNKFFELPIDQLQQYTEPPFDRCILYTSSFNFAKEKFHYWRDVLTMECSSLNTCIDKWPSRPPKFRTDTWKFVSEAKAIGSIILNLIAKGLGLENGYFETTELSAYTALTVNRYPPCPKPKLTSGLPKHCDPNLLTILFQGEVPGFQVFINGRWMLVEPSPNTAIVIFGRQLQIVSNGRLRSVEHRVVTNAQNARTTASIFIAPSMNCFVQPAEVLTRTTPSRFRSFQSEEYLRAHVDNYGNSAVIFPNFMK